MADKLTTNGELADGPLQPDAFLKLLAELVSAQVKEDSAAGLRRQIKGRFEKIGAHKKGLDLFLKLRKMETEDAEATLSAALRYCRWANLAVGAQLSMFPASDDAPAPSPKAVRALLEADLYREGFDAGFAERAADDHRFEVGSEDAQVWAQGWVAGDQARKRLSQVGGEDEDEAPKRGRNRGTTSAGRGRRGASNPEDRPEA